MAERICSLPECERRSKGRGLCPRHYLKAKRAGTLPPLEPKVYYIVADDGCWVWQSADNGTGYGVKWANGRQGVAHRWMYEKLVGPIPEGLQLDHLCRNRKCVNPEHLEPVTNRENGLRGTSPAAKNARKTHCLRGHPFDEVNTYWEPSRAGRACRECKRQQQRAAGKRDRRKIKT